MTTDREFFLELLNNYPDGLPAGFRAFWVGGSKSTVVTPPVDPPPERPEAFVSFSDGAGGSNKLVPTFDVPSTQGNKAMVWEKTSGLIETACTAGQKGIKPVTFENLMNIYTAWAFLPAGQTVKNAGGKWIEWPEELKTPGGVIPYPDDYTGQWVSRDKLAYNVSEDYIRSLVEWTLGTG